MNRRTLIAVFIMALFTIPLFTRTVSSQEGAGEIVNGYERIDLRLTGDNGFGWQGSFAGNAQPTIGLVLPDGTQLADGRYEYELQYVPALSSQTEQIMAEAKSAGNRAEVEAQLRADGLLASARVEFGTFVIQNGALLSQTSETNDDLPSDFPIDQDEPLEDQVISDDLIVQGSACVGFDCVNGESFGDDTIRLKENNLRIFFQDTSASASFPSNDWQLTANDSTNGGLNKFSIDDVSGGRIPFTIEAGARSNALYVEADGDVGIGTSNPVVEAHIVTGNTPTVRLDQDGTSGFTPQVWDVAGNEANFFIRDVTNGSRLSFRIRPGAPESSIDIQANGDVRLQDWDLSRTNTNFTISPASGGVTTLDLDDNGNLILSGALTEASDRNIKENFADIDPMWVLKQINNMPIQSWNYIADGAEIRHIGPVAQDFYSAFGVGIDNKHIAPLDANGVALAGIQALSEIVESQDAEIATLQAENQALNERLSELEALVESLVAEQASK